MLDSAWSTEIRPGANLLPCPAPQGVRFRLGLTTAQLSEPTSDVPGTLLRVRVDGDSPLARDVGATAWQFYSYDLVMRQPDPAKVAVAYPAATSPDWFVSGFERGASELGGTAAVVDEKVGEGRAVLFGGEPNFRAFTDGTAQLLVNAITGPDPSPRVAGTGLPAPSGAAAALPQAESPIRVSVKAADAARTTALLRSVGAQWRERRSGDAVQYVIDNPRGLPVDHHPFAGRLASLIRGSGIDPIAVTLP
jgi:hypothetical protein